MEVAAARALHHARRAGDEQALAEALELTALADVHGPLPVQKAAQRLNEYIAWARLKGARNLEGTLLAGLALLQAMAGRHPWLVPA